MKRRPPLLLERRIRRRLERRRRGGDGGRRNGAREALKSVVLFLYVHAWAPVRNAWNALRGKSHTAILLYHRISDEYLDSVTAGLEQFQRHLRILLRGYDVIDMPAFLASRGAPRRRPAVVITFDDGYADNHLAARLLRRAGLPCTFFICTRIVGTESPFPHDARKLGKTVPSLSWDQVREMARWGFHFANHTAHHVDVAKVPLAEAMGEIETAAKDLVARLGPTGAERWFAYPSGRPHNITEDVRGSLDSCGIDHCFSAYGGVDPPEFDRRNILRQGINYNVGDLAFRAFVEGWKLR